MGVDGDEADAAGASIAALGGAIANEQVGDPGVLVHGEWGISPIRIVPALKLAGAVRRDGVIDRAAARAAKAAGDREEFGILVVGRQCTARGRRDRHAARAAFGRERRDSGAREIAGRALRATAKTRPAI